MPKMTLDRTLDGLVQFSTLNVGTLFKRPGHAVGVSSLVYMKLDPVYERGLSGKHYLEQNVVCLNLGTTYFVEPLECVDTNVIIVNMKND